VATETVVTPCSARIAEKKCLLYETRKFFVQWLSIKKAAFSAQHITERKNDVGKSTAVSAKQSSSEHSAASRFNSTGRFFFYLDRAK
jgi:hypothetical protein